MPRRTAILAAAGTAALMSSVLAGAGAIRAGTARYTGTIAFIRMASDKVFGGPLFVVHPDGSGLRRLTPSTTKVYSYAWSPDGRLIAYLDQRLSLWLVRPDGAGRRLLVPTSRLSSVALSWSPDGKEVAFLPPGSNLNERNAPCGETTLYVVPIRGGPPEPLPSGRAGCGVAWSPRGDEIAYDGNGISVIGADGTGRRRVSPVGGGVWWSADGGQLAFRVAIGLRNGFTDRYRAFAVANADGTGFHVVTTHAYNEYGVAWSPSGRRILYGRAASKSIYVTESKGIYVIGSDGRNNRRVTRDSPPRADWGALAWSPSGGAIVYTTGGGNTDLYVIGVDGRDKVQLTNTPDDDIDPSWVAR